MTISVTTLSTNLYRACLLHLNNFQKRIAFSEVDETLIARFKNYLSNLKGRNGKMDPVTIKYYWDKLKSVLFHAAKKDHFLDLTEPVRYFEEVKVGTAKKKEGQHLEVEEILKLKMLAFTENEKSFECDRDLFLFRVYTGVCYNELQKLKKDQLFNDTEQGHYIISERDKKR